MGNFALRVVLIVFNGAPLLLQGAEAGEVSGQGKISIKRMAPKSMNVQRQGWYTVQVGVFRKKNNAARLYQTLRDQDLFVKILSMKHKRLGSVYVVRTKVMKYYKAKSYGRILSEATGLKPSLVRMHH